MKPNDIFPAVCFPDLFRVDTRRIWTGLVFDVCFMRSDHRRDTAWRLPDQSREERYLTAWEMTGASKRN